ncbi:MAG: slipin family protein [Pseudomonadota bacterium]
MAKTQTPILPSAPRTLLDAIMGRQRIILSENERAVLLVKGRLEDILGPGEHVVAYPDATVERHNVELPTFSSAYERVLMNQRPGLVERHLTEFTVGEDEIGVIERDGRIFALLKPEGRSLLWTDSGPWSLTRIKIPADLAVERDLAKRLERFQANDKVRRFEVASHQAGLLFVDGALQRRLPPGAHAFWSVGPRLEMKLIDLRAVPLDVHGQEILTRDRVSIRVNLAAEYRVVDPEKAVAAVEDFRDTLYRSVQFAFRRTLGARTLDEILEEMVGIDADADAALRADMAEIGLDVGEIALKDVILPGDMREILNQVVTAEKQAQANVIKRREETAATRSLLNTAKVMAENPIMLRLKELEALEAIAEKVDRLVIHNGAKGLMQDVARLVEPEDDEPL